MENLLPEKYLGRIFKKIRIRFIISLLFSVLILYVVITPISSELETEVSVQTLVTPTNQQVEDSQLSIQTPVGSVEIPDSNLETETEQYEEVQASTGTIISTVTLHPFGSVEIPDSNLETETEQYEEVQASTVTNTSIVTQDPIDTAEIPDSNLETETEQYEEVQASTVTNTSIVTQDPIDTAENQDPKPSEHDGDNIMAGDQTEDDLVNPVGQATLWGINLGQPKPYYVYPLFSQPETRQTLKDAGVKVVRIFDKWETYVNREQVVNELVDAGFTPVIVTGGNRALDYVRTCGTKAMYELGNEPNFEEGVSPTDYASKYKSTADQIVDINPDVKLIAGAIGVWQDLGNIKEYPESGLDYITETVATGAKIDYVSYHYYTSWQGEIFTKEQVLERANNFAEITQIISDATGLPVACTEWNIGDYAAPRWDLDETFISQWTERAMNGMNGCAISCQWFVQNWDSTWEDSNPQPMLEINGTPKPMYYIFKKIAEMGS